MNKNIIFCVLLLFFGQILVWYQLNSQLVWEWAKTSKSMWFMSLMGIPISLLFWYATKIGYVGFGNLWAVRFIGFATSMLTFPLMTYLYLGEAMSVKTLLTLALATVIMLIQIFL